MVAVDIWNAITEEALLLTNAELCKNQTWSKVSYPRGWVVQTHDGCFYKGVVSFGYVIRDPTSNIFVAATKRIPSVTSPAIAEILAIR